MQTTDLRYTQREHFARRLKIWLPITNNNPIGAFLFWEISKDKLDDYDFYEFLKNYDEKNSVHNKKADLKGADGVTAVLDGQQRLTSIYIGLKGTYAYRLKYKQKKNDNAYPVRKLYLNLINIAKDGTNKYDFEFKICDTVKNSAEEYWFEVGKILEMDNLGDVTTYVTDDISFSEEFSYTKQQAKFATNTSIDVDFEDETFHRKEEKNYSW